MKKNIWITALGISALALALGACTITTDDGNDGKGGSSGSGQGGAAQGGNAQGGAAQGGSAQGGAAQGGNAQGGAAQGGNAQGGAAQGGNAQGGEGQGGSPQLTDCNQWYPDKVEANSCEVCVRQNCCDKIKECWNDKGKPEQQTPACKPFGACVIEKAKQECKDGNADGCRTACGAESNFNEYYSPFADCVLDKCTDKCFATTKRK